MKPLWLLCMFPSSPRGWCLRTPALVPITPWMSNYDLLARAACDIDPLAPTVHRLMTVVGGGNWHLDEVAESVAFGPVLTAKLLRRVNSAASASRVEIVNVKHAVSCIGISPLMSVVAAACLPRAPRSALPRYGLAEGQFWQHLVASSLAADVVQRRSTQPLPLETSTAALLHDIGKLVIGRLVDRESLECMECARELGEGLEVEMPSWTPITRRSAASSDSIGNCQPGW